MPVFGNATDIKFNGVSATKAFLNNNQIWPINNVQSVSSGLELYYDPSNTLSYPGSGSVLYDLSPNRVNATVSGTGIDSGNWFTFDGNDTIMTGNLFSLFSGWTHSLEIWVNPSIGCQVFSDLGIASFGGYHTTGLEFYSVGPTMISNAMLWSSTSTTRVGGGVTPLNNWYQIVRVYNGSNTAYTYVNKVKSSDTSISWITPSPGWYLGFGYSDGTKFAATSGFQGKLGVIRLYNKVLTQTEINQNYDATKVLYGL